VFEQETIAILEALLKWEYKLISYHIHVVTDHEALEFFKMQKNLSGRQACWMEFLSRSGFDIRYVKGQDNKVADTLSCYYEYRYMGRYLSHVRVCRCRDSGHEDLSWDYS
jgi:hypothetical protein